MASKTILILGGYGNTGTLLARLLLAESDARIILAGRNLEKAISLAQQLNGLFSTNRVGATWVDASSINSLKLGLQDADLVVVASSTSQYTQLVASAALGTGVDYLDIQYSPKKNAILHSMEGEIQRAGRCFITDGGFHPGLPALLSRYVSQFFDRLESARVGSVIKEDWKKLQFGYDTVRELVELINDLEMLTYKAGKWQKVSLFSTADFIRMDFGEKFGTQYCAPMMLEEMRKLPEMYPTLKDTGFYVGSFNWFVDWVIMPIATLAMKINPSVAIIPMGRWMYWGLKTFSEPPYGTVLRVEATGRKDSQAIVKNVTISHADGYMFTAIPVAACLLQYLDDTIHKPGLFLQAQIVEPLRFMRDMEHMGIRVETSGGEHEMGTHRY